MMIRFFSTVFFTLTMLVVLLLMIPLSICTVFINIMDWAFTKVMSDLYEYSKWVKGKFTKEK